MISTAVAATDDIIFILLFLFFQWKQKPVSHMAEPIVALVTKSGVKYAFMHSIDCPAVKP